MFESFKSKKADVLSHWYALVHGFQTSSEEFYAEVEKGLQARSVPGLELSRVEFAEGGILSDKRVYLRMLRERLVFDICAAPFGKSYFFSCRFAEIPARIRPWEMIAFIFGILALLYASVKMLGFFEGPFILLILVGFLLWLSRNAVSLGLRNLDAALIKTPVIGPLYERYLRSETYYRHDSRLMYMETVNEVVKTKVEEVTGIKGIKLLRFNENNPILSELYKTPPR